MTQKCKSWTFDRSTYTNTIIHQYNLVCDREGYTNIAQTVYFAGLMLGVFGAGWTADFFGRKTAMVPITFFMALFGAVSSFMPNVESFITVRFLQGMTNIGIFAVAFVWCMEVVGGKWQTIIGIGLEGPWVVGWFLLALIAHLAPDWRHIQLITSLPAFLCVLALWFLPESPKWLLAMGRTKKAEKMVRTARKVNGLPDLPENWHLTPIKEDNKARLQCLTHGSNVMKNEMLTMTMLPERMTVRVHYLAHNQL